MARVAAIAPGPRSSSPRGRRAFSFWGFLGLSAIWVRNAWAALVPADARGGNLSSLHLAPLAGRGRNSGNARISGEGDYPRVPMRREAPHPTLSPQERGEGVIECACLTPRRRRSQDLSNPV